MINKWGERATEQMNKKASFPVLPMRGRSGRWTTTHSRSGQPSSACAVPARLTTYVGRLGDRRGGMKLARTAMGVIRPMGVGHRILRRRVLVTLRVCGAGRSSARARDGDQGRDGGAHADGAHGRRHVLLVAPCRYGHGRPRSDGGARRARTGVRASGGWRRRWRCARVDQAHEAGVAARLRHPEVGAGLCGWRREDDAAERGVLRDLSEERGQDCARFTVTYEGKRSPRKAGATGGCNGKDGENGRKEVQKEGVKREKRGEYAHREGSGSTLTEGGCRACGGAARTRAP